MNQTTHTLATLSERFASVHERIANAERRYGRISGSVELLAVSKFQPASIVAAAHAMGHTAFGENYLQEALPKIAALKNGGIIWHFTGALQSNKTQAAAQHFAWVHSIDRLKIAERLNTQRPASLPPLNVCIQINIGNEAQKSGIAPPQAAELAHAISLLPRVSLRGLMALPPPSEDAVTQLRHFSAVRKCFEELQRQGLHLDTLSMGMSNDLETAIAEGATLVRVGTALFGERPLKR